MIEEVSKASRVKTALDGLLKATAGLEPRIAAVVTKAIADLRASLSETALTRVLDREGLPGLLRLIEPRLERFSADLAGATDAQGVKETLQASYLAGAESARQMVPKAIGLQARFDLTNPRALIFLQNYDFGLIREVTNETRLAIRDVVFEGFNRGLAPREQARSIRDMIGLTRKQSRAVVNFRAQLEGQEGRGTPAHLRRLDAIERRQALRQVREGGMTAQQITDLVESYRQRLVNLRATTIARTETIRASSQGQDDLWSQMQADGLLNSNETRRKWIVTKDDRLCPICAAIPGMNPKGAPVGGTFQTPVGPVSGPPAHPTCRCATSLMIERI